MENAFFRYKPLVRDTSPCAHSCPHATPQVVVEQILHFLRRTYHLGPVRIVWYLARYVGQARWTWATLLPEDPILLPEIIDHVFLVASSPSQRP